MADYTVGDFLGQDSTEYLVTQLLLKIKAVRDMLSGITHIDVQVADNVPVNPPAHPDTTLYVVLVSEDPEVGDLFTEYIWVVSSSTWERVGRAQVDLTDYAKKTDIGNATLTIKVGDIILGTFSANAKSDATITLDLTAYALKTDIGEIGWMVTGNESSGTTIDTNGLLTIDEHETASRLVITAFLPYNTNISTSTIINISLIDNQMGLSAMDRRPFVTQDGNELTVHIWSESPGV